MTAPNPSTALARVMIDELWRAGLRKVVLAPGSRSAALALAAVEHPGLDVVVHLDERSAAFYALGVGRAEGPAAVVTTSGTAAANLMPAVVEADIDQVPLVLLTADRPPSLRHFGANQTIDQIGMFGRFPRWFCEVGVAEDRPDANAYWRSVADRAVAEAAGLSGRPGPVHLNLAFHEPLIPVGDDGRTRADPFSQDIAGRDGGGPWTRLEHAEPGVPTMAFPAELAVERGLVVVGTGRWSWAGAELAEQLGWPLVAEGSSGARRPGAISTAHHLASQAHWADDHLPEVVVTFGRPATSRPVAAMARRANTVVAVRPNGWIDPDHVARVVLPAIPGWVRKPRSPGEWTAAWRRADAAARRVIDAVLDEEPRPTEPRTARDTARAVPVGGRLVVASSMPVRDLDMFMEPRHCSVYANRGASGIDGFVSTVLGVAATEGEAPVALAGDLSLLHDANGFLADRRRDCVIVVVNNDGGGIFSFLPQASLPEHFERVFATPHGRRPEDVARLHGIGHRLVEHANDLTGVVGEARRAGGVWLVEVRTDRGENLELHRRITTAVGEVV